MKNNIILMVLPPQSSHLTQPLDVGVFKPLKTVMASAIEPLVSTELHRIMKAEWLLAYVEAHDGAFSIRNIKSGFSSTGIMPLNSSKVIDRIKSSAPMPQDAITIQDSTPTKLITPFTESILTSSPLNSDETRSANAALLNEIATGVLSTPVIRRSECAHVRNIIIEQEHEKLKAAVTKRKAILSGKRKIVDGKHILTVPEVHNLLVEAEKKRTKRKTTETKKNKRGTIEVEQEYIDETKASSDEQLVVLECIEVQ